MSTRQPFSLPSAEEAILAANTVGDPASRPIEERINAVMKAAQYADKTRVNAHMKYKFTGHEDVTKAIRESMVENGIIQLVSVDECIREGSAVRVKVRIEWRGGGSVVVFAYGESFSVNKSGTPDDVQIGKAVSYAVKTAQLKNFMLLGDTTPDSEESHGREERRPEPKADSDAEQRAVELVKELDDCPADHEVFAAIVKSIEAIHTKVSKATIARLNTAYMQAEKRIEDGIRN